MKPIHRIYTHIILFCLTLVAQNATAQVTGDQYASSYSKIENYKVKAIEASSSSSKVGEQKESAVDGNTSTMWKCATDNDKNPYIILDVGDNYAQIDQIELYVGNTDRVAKSVIVSTSNDRGDNWADHASQDLDQVKNNIISLTGKLKGNYLRLKFERRKSDEQIGISEVYFYTKSSDKYSSVTIQHKRAKWYDQRETLITNNEADNFDDDESMAMNLGYDGKTWIQAAHTLIDTIYVHRGTSVTLTLPDYLNKSTNNKTYQRWYDYLTEGTFATSESKYATEHENGIYDLLTPGTPGDNMATNGTGYRFANGYVGQPLSSNGLYIMDFYVPNDNQNWYLVACDVSGYKDYTKEFSNQSKKSKFGDKGEYWEPTLSHRFIYFIRVIEDENSWANKRLKAGLPIEEKDITMPATRLPDYTNEMVALSMDARSYITPKGNNDEANGKLTVKLGSINTAGISLCNQNRGGSNVDSLSLSDEDRVIFITYPTKNADNTMSVKQTTDGSDPKATINVYRNSTLVAKYNLTFKEESRLMTQTQVSQENENPDSKYTYRMPDYLNNNYELLTELNFDFDEKVASNYGQIQCYPFPLGWDSSTYGFYDGGVSEGDFKQASSMCPEWGYYGILNSYVECNGIDGKNWGWTGYTYNVPNDSTPIRYNSKGNKSTFHLYADVSDRPGVIARLPFDRKLCPGTELFVTAWVKCARRGGNSNNPAALFTIMGVKSRGVGTSSTKDYTPIYRFQTGQIPATYRNDGGLCTSKFPGFVLQDGNTGGNNDWLQVYFSFINTNSEDFDSYVLQIDNNSASTAGGDIYIDDIRVYVMSPNSKVTQLESTCTNERTLTNFKLNWSQLLSRLGYDENSKDQKEDVINFCFIDKTKYYNYLEEHKTDYAGAVKASVIEVGDNEESGSNYHRIYFKMPFEDNTNYNEAEFPRLASKNVKDDKEYFYGYTSDAGIKALSIDFYTDITPNRPYILLINHDADTDDELNENDFNYNIDDACVIKTEFYVTAQTLMRINGEVLDPSTDFCTGQVFKFSANMRVPTGVDEDGNTIYKEIKDGIYYDWFFGTEEEFLAANPEYGDASLQSALTTFREIFPNKENLDDVTAGEYTSSDNTSTVTLTQNDIDIINDYLNDTGATDGVHNRLVLHKANLDIMLLESGLNLVMQPIPTLISPDEEISDSLWAKVCWEYIPLELNTSGEAPQLHAGFNAVKYPTDDFNPGLRIGLKQIIRTNDGKTLKVDLRGAKLISEEAKSLGMVKSSSSDVFKNIYLVGTDDPEYNNDKFFPTDFSEYSLPIGTLTELYAEPYGQGSEFNDHMNIYFDTTTTLGNGFQFKPKEGYSYTFAVHFEEHGEDGTDVSNACFGVFTVNMKVVPENLVWKGGATSNWNNDKNWKRADATDLKNTDGTYTTNEENTTDNGFVPMLFSNVIMPGGSAAELYMAGYGEGGAWTNSNRPDYMELPEDSIQYDLMAYEKDDALTTQRYRVNICRDIHFEPGAQMLHAEQLLYNKAWTDVELNHGQWTAISTPLHGVVAGDWYTQTSGRQETEYFKDITFGTDNSRLNPAVYQRSWSKGATIVENGGGTTPVSFDTEWSSAYNDASVPYVAGGGFSVKGVAEASGTLLFRFPKADTEYTVSTVVDGTIDRTNTGKLLISGLLDRSDPLHYDPKEDVTTTLTPSADGKFIMVGNPFMAPLDVRAFVEGNSDVLVQKYWISTTNEEEAVAYDAESGWSAPTSLVAPYSVFYVEPNTTGADVPVKFTKDMQKFADASTGEGAQTTALMITAENTNGASSAAVRYTASASNGFGIEDAQMISGLTGNTENVPKVYTVAGNTAVSVNQLKDMQRIPLGVAAAEGSAVTLTFSGVAAIKDATLFDAEQQSETTLYDGYQLTLDGPSYGRYFITGRGAGTTDISETAAEGYVNVSSIAPRQVVVTSNSELNAVSIWSVSGVLLKKVTPNGNYTCTINGVDSGIVIVRTDTAAGIKMTKLEVK